MLTVRNILLCEPKKYLRAFSPTFLFTFELKLDRLTQVVLYSRRGVKRAYAVIEFVEKNV